MNSFEPALSQALDVLRAEGLRRELREIESPQAARIHWSEKSYVNFSSNDYLGLANSPVLRAAATEAIDRFGVGSGASRLISGSLAPHHRLEQALAEFKGTAAALSFSSGYGAAVGTIPALVGTDDVVVLDKLVHACIVDAARLSGAKLRIFRHNDLNSLEDILKWADSRQNKASPGRRPRTLIVTESIFSMDGDHAPLPELVKLKEKHGAWLMVDEAHGTGLYGRNRRGVVEHFGVVQQIEIQMGTLGKALGASGGFICGSQKLIELLIHRARSFVFSTAPVPAAAAAAEAAIRFIQSPAGERQCQLLWQRVSELPKRFRRGAAVLPSAIIPVLTGSESSALNAFEALLEQGLFVPAIRYPTVARGKARLRVTLSAAHTAPDTALLAAALEQHFPLTEPGSAATHQPSPISE